MAKKENSPVVADQKVAKVEEQVTKTVAETVEVKQEDVVVDVAVEVPVAEEVVETVKPAEEKKAKKDSSEVKVVKIVQKTPSGYRLLLETGEIVRVTKKDYTKGQEFISL